MDQLRNGTPNLSTSTSTTCSVRNLIEAVAKIRHQKQCATVVRIHKAVRQQLQRNIDVEEVIQQLALATNSGSLWRVDNNGVTSYREPPKGSSKEQVRWSQKESTRWSNKEAQVRSASSNAKYSIPDHAPYAVPDNNMFQQMADQFSWCEARRWTESVTPWNMEPVRQHLGDPIAWPMNESLKRPLNDPISWTSSDQYRIVQESFPWPMPADSFAWPGTEPWRQTMIEQFKRAEGSGNFVFDNMNYRSLVEPTQKNLINDPNQWTASDDSSKQQKCSLPKETFHSPRDQLSSMSGPQNSNIVSENMHSLDKQHKNNLSIMVNQDFPDTSVKSIPQVDMECTSNWYVNNKGIPPDQIMNFPVQERKEFNNSCPSPNNYLTPAYASENSNSLQNSTPNQHISSHFYEASEGRQANESFSNGIQASESSYGHTYMENNSMYCEDNGTYKSIDQESANKPQYHNQYESVTWTNYSESEEMQASKVCFSDKLEQENFNENERSKNARVVETCDTQKSTSKSENVSRNEFAISAMGTTMIQDDDDADSSDSSSQILHDKPPNLTTFLNNFQERKGSEQNAIVDSSPPVLGDPLVNIRVANSGEGEERVKSKESIDEDWLISDCRKSCDNQNEVCHHLKIVESLSDLNGIKVLASSAPPNKLKSREAPLPILEKLTPQSLKSELNLTTSEGTSALATDAKKFEGVTSEKKLQSLCKNESGGHKRKMNIFDTLIPTKCSKVSEVHSTTSNKDIDEESKKSCSVKLPATILTSLQPPTDIHLRGLVDGLTRFFTPSNKRSSRVSQNAVQSNTSIVQASFMPSLARLRKPPISPSFVKVKKLFSKPPIGKSISNASAFSSSSPANSGLSSLTSRKPRREQLIDGLSHFFSAQGKRKTRFNKTMYNDNDVTARSRSSSGQDNLILEKTPRLRASSANASSASSLIPLSNSVRWSSENLVCKESNFHVNPLMVSRLKSTKWLSITRKQPESLLLKLNSPATSTLSSNGELPAAMSPDSLCNNPQLKTKSEEMKTTKPNEASDCSKVEQEEPTSPSKIYPLKPTSEDSLLFRKARENFLKRFNSESCCSSVNLSSIQFGEFKIEVSYLSNFSNEFSSLPVLYFCEFCLKYYKNLLPLQKHLNTCMCRRPPGNEIYRTSGGFFSIYEVEACTNTMYCEHLCSMSRLFVEPELQMLFSSSTHLFYILTKNDHQGSHLVGYFVRDRSHGKGPCLVFLCVLPPYRRKGYASLLINFSYQLCKLLNVPGFLKRIFSVPILSAFQQYWSWAILDYFQHSWNHKQPLTVKDLSKSLGIASTNITSTLLKLGIIQTKARSKSAFNPNVRAIESHAKELMRKDKSIIRINFKNICIESSLLLKDRLTTDQVTLLNSKGASDDEEYHLDNDDSGISLHCGSCGESQQESVNSIVSEGMPISTDDPTPPVSSSDWKSQSVVESLTTSKKSEIPTGLKATPASNSDGDDKTTFISMSSVHLIGMVKKESRSVEVQTDAYESEYSSDEYDDDDDEDDDDDDDEDNEVDNGPADNLSTSQQISKDEKNSSLSHKAYETSNSSDGLKIMSEDAAVSQESFNKNEKKNLPQPHDTNNNTNKKIQEELYSGNSKMTENNLNTSEHSSSSEFKESLEKNVNNLIQGGVCINIDPDCKNNSNKKTSQQLKEQALHRNSHIESFSYQLPSPANSDMRSPSSISSYPMSNQPPGKSAELTSEKTTTNDQNASPSGPSHLDKTNTTQSINKFTNECYLPSDTINVPTSSSPSVYTGLYFNNPLNPLFINQNSPGSINCNHYNMPTPSPTNSSSRSFGMASPNSNNFQTPQINPQLIDRGCPSAPMLTYGRVACPQPSNDGQFPWAPIYHSQPAPAGYSFIKFSDQEIMPCGIAPFPSMTPIPDSFTNAITLGPPSKCLPTTGTSQPSKIPNRKCGNKTCKSSASTTQCNSFRSQSVAPNVTIQPGTNVITNYNVLNMNVTPEYRNHQPITYPSPPYIAATNPAFIGQTAKQHINIYQHQAIGFSQQPQHHNGMYAAATYNYLNGAIAPQSFSINVNNIMK